MAEEAQEGVSVHGRLGPNDPTGRDRRGDATGPVYDRRQGQETPAGETPPTRGPAVITSSAPSDQEVKGPGEGMRASTEELFSDGWLLQKANEIYTFSTDYLDSNITNEWERNLAHFHSEHAPGTPYRSGNWRRSRVFRPKTRANVKQQEAALANAIFSTLHPVSITPEDDSLPRNVLSAAVNKIILSYRLENTIPWFLTVQGAYQDTKVYGLCISHQHWDYAEDTDVEPAFDENGDIVHEEDPETGKKVAMGYERHLVRRDEPRCDLFPPENFRFDPMCDWRNPAKSSPYLVAMFPMYAGEVLEFMERSDPKTGRSAWRRHSLAEILSTRREDYNRTRQAREGRERIDPADEQRGNEFTTVWAHMNIIRVNGTDWVYWTLGTDLVVTEPEPLRDVYPWLLEGERPFVVGFSTVEAHRNYPAGDVEQGSPLQQEMNDVANQRLDNVKLVLNKRYYVKRGSQVDLDALIRNTPGGGVMMNDPESDVKTVDTRDVTSSSYSEQALLAQEYDDLLGGFNPATAQNQKSQGGAFMAGASAGAVQDYGIKVFVETWMEPVLRQLARIEQMYETDEVVLSLAARKAQAFQRFGVDSITDEILQQGLTIRVNAGMGNTDPMRRVERLIFGVTKTAELPGMALRLKSTEVSDEIFGALGYRDGTRFFMTDEEFEEFMANQPEQPTEMDLKMQELQIRREDNQLRDARENRKLDQERELRSADIEGRISSKLDELMARLHQTEMTSQTQRDIAAGNISAKHREMNIKQATGEGI